MTTDNGSIDFVLAVGRQLELHQGRQRRGGGNADRQPTATSCTLGIAFVPTHFGARSTNLTVGFDDGSSQTLALSGTGVGGYYLAGASAEWTTFGNAPADLESGGSNLARPGGGHVRRRDRQRLLAGRL